MKEAERFREIGGDAEIMSDYTLKKLIEYLKSVKELADKCQTLDEFREALARIIAKK